MIYSQTIQLAGLTCQACTKLTSKRIQRITGVTDVSVNLDDQVAKILSIRTVSPQEVKDVLSDTQYTVEES